MKTPFELKILEEMERLTALVRNCDSDNHLTWTVAQLIKAIREGERQRQIFKEAEYLREYSQLIETNWIITPLYGKGKNDMGR